MAEFTQRFQDYVDSIDSLNTDIKYKSFFVLVSKKGRFHVVPMMQDELQEGFGYLPQEFDHLIVFFAFSGEDTLYYSAMDGGGGRMMNRLKPVEVMFMNAQLLSVGSRELITEQLTVIDSSEFRKAGSGYWNNVAHIATGEIS
jgi:hypothetical protein